MLTTRASGKSCFRSYLSELFAYSLVFFPQDHPCLLPHGKFICCAQSSFESLMFLFAPFGLVYHVGLHLYVLAFNFALSARIVDCTIL